METISEQVCFGGRQGFYRHASAETKTPMRFAVFTPPQAAKGPVPVVWFLAGLTCTEENFTVKAGAQRAAAELGLMLVAPDTSPRGEGVPGDPDNAYDFGLGAGFYLDATQSPWAANYRMYSYITLELPGVIAAHFPADMQRQGISGHSMGGHGALTIALKNPQQYSSVTAFAPIVAPSQVPWGQKALGRYLGEDRAAWRAYDSVALIEDGRGVPKMLIDQGDADKFLKDQLQPERLATACKAKGIECQLRMQPGYDHSYYFIASFIDDHLRWHAAALLA
ncbi:MAG: S-formylglutathione hydrolase [Rhodospirillaceae bacterium]|nr:S-formylglutathione hydrolase [Rhodospirillaceae bacterium]